MSQPETSSTIALASVRPVSDRRRTLRLTYIDGVFYSIMVGTAESFAIFYGLQRGLSLDQVAIVATLPILIGALAQWLIPMLVPNHALKPAIVGSVAVQLAGLCGILCIPFATGIFEILLGSLVLYWVGGMVAAPLWLDWIAPWLPHRSFTTYLSRRNAVLALTVLVAFIASAVVIHASGWVHAFAAVFAIAAVARAVSLVLILRQSSPPSTKRRGMAKGLAPNLAWVRKPVYAVIAVTTLFKFACNISSPFFMPYMVKDLRLNLIEYVGLSAIPFAGRWLFLSRRGKAAKAFRPFIALQAAMFFIALSPTLWTFTNDMRALTLFELYSGIMWGGFDLCAVLIIQNFWPGSARRLIGFHLAAMGLFSLLGAALGSQLMKAGWGYHDLFLFSSLVRASVAILGVAVLWTIPETRYSLKVYGDFLATVLTLRPSLANIGRIIPLRRRRGGEPTPPKGARTDARIVRVARVSRSARPERAKPDDLPRRPA